MKITFIGTGSIIPNPKINNNPTRSYSAILVEIGKDTLLFDIGPGTLTKLQQIGFNTQLTPTHLFITHYHIDHSQDYIALVKSRTLSKEQKQINVYGPVELKEWTTDLFEKTKRWSYMKNQLNAFNYINLKETQHGTAGETENWKVTCLPIKHYDGVAFRLDAEGKSFVYSGDMTYDENLSKLGKNADIVAVECSYPDRKSLKGLHLCPEDIVKLAKLGNFKQTFLTHLYPACEGREQEMIKYIEKNSNTKVTVAHDFLSIPL